MAQASSQTGGGCLAEAAPAAKADHSAGRLSPAVDSEPKADISANPDRYRHSSNYVRFESIKEILRISCRRDLCVRHGMHGLEKRIVYILRSLSSPSRHYTGITNDVVARLEWHNDGPCGHTLHHRPWSFVVSMEFPSEKAARRFEKLLKSGSGRAFTKRHFALIVDG